MVSISMLASDVDGKTDWDLANMIGSSDFGIRATIFGDNKHVQEVYVGVNTSVPSSVACLLPLNDHEGSKWMNHLSWKGK